MIWRLACALACCGSQVAADFCEDILALNGLGSEAALALPITTSDVVTCTQSIALGGQSQLHCGWAFAYRDAAAQAAFQAGLQQLDQCFEQTTPDQDVNHPDFYDLRLFISDDFEIGLSLKDKAALQETYVFLRIAPR